MPKRDTLLGDRGDDGVRSKDDKNHRIVKFEEEQNKPNECAKDDHCHETRTFLMNNAMMTR